MMPFSLLFSEMAMALALASALLFCWEESIMSDPIVFGFGVSSGGINNE